MSLTGKKTRDPSNLPTLSYEIPLKLPTNVESQPQEISFLDLIANDTKFKNDKESLELVLSSYVKACGKQSVKEILAEHDSSMDEKTSLADIIRVLMDYNDQQNADLGVGYADPEDDDSFIDDSTAAQDIIPRNMKNEREGFYVNEKHQPIQARLVSESSDNDSDDSDESDETDDDDSDDDDDDDDDSETSKSGKEDEDPTKKNKINPMDPIEKELKKRKIEEETKGTATPTIFLNAKRKRSVSEAAAPSLLTTTDDKTKSTIIADESVKKVKKLSETSGETCVQNFITSVLPNELESDIKPIIEKLVKLILAEQTTNSNLQKKIERLYDPNVSRELLDLAKKLQRHTNANRQLVFDVFAARTNICASLLVTRARLLLLNDYEPMMNVSSLNDLKEKLKVEVQKSLETHIQSHNQAVKDWQQKMVENPPKEKIRGPRKNFRFHKNINELIIRCVDRQLETMTMLDTDSLELFLQNHIVPLWSQTGWITAKKIITEVIRMEYRPLRDINQMAVPATMITPPLPRPNTTSQSPTANNPPAQATPPRTSTSTSTAERMKKDSPTIVSPMPKSVPTQSSPRPAPLPTTTQSSPRPPSHSSHSNRPTDPKSNETKVSASSSTNSTQNKPLEMATRVSNNTSKTVSTSRPVVNEAIHSQISDQLLAKNIPADIIRTVAKPVIVSPNPVSDSSAKRLSTPNPPAAIDLTIDLLNQYKKFTQDSPSSSHRSHSHSSSHKDSTHSSHHSSPQHRTTSSSSTSHSNKQQHVPFSTKNPIDKPTAGSLLKEALLTTTTTTTTITPTTPTATKISSSKVSSSPLTVDSMLNKPLQSPKVPSNISSSSTTATKSSSSVVSSPTTNSSQRSSSSVTKVSSSHHRTDQHSHQSKSHSSSSSNSHRPPSTTQSSTTSSSSTTTPSSSGRRSTPIGLPSNFSSTHDSQSLRNLSSQLPLSSALSQSLSWDPAAIQLAAAALANPQLLNSSVFDANLFNSVFGGASNLISSSGSSSSPSSSRHSQSQNNSNQRRS